MMGSRITVGGLLLVCSVITDPAFAQLEQAATTPVPDVSKHTQVERQSPQPATAPQEAGRRHAAQLSKLHSAIKKRLGLSSTQEKSIERLFRRQLSVLNGGRTAERYSGARDSDATELASLRERLQSARKAGDERALRKLRQEFRDKITTRTTADALSTDDFLAKVSAQMSSDQQEEFRQLARSILTHDRLGRSGTDELRKFWRAVSNQAVGLSSEQRRTATGIVRDGVADLSQAQKDGTDGAPIIEAVRREVFKQLNPGQLEKVEIALGLRPRPVPDESETIVTLVADKSQDAKAEPKPEVKTAPQPKAEPVEASKVEPTPEPKVEEKPEPTPKAEPIPVPEPKVEPKPEPAAVPKPAPKEESPKELSGESQPKPAAKPGPSPKPEKDSGAGKDSDQKEAPDKDDDEG